MHTCNKHTHPTVHDVVLTHRPSLHFSFVSNNNQSQLPTHIHTAHLPPSITLHLAERDGLNCFSLGVSSTKSSVARVQWQQRRKCGQVKRNKNTLPTMSSLFRDKLQQKGCWGWIVKFTIQCLLQKLLGIKKCTGEIRLTETTYNILLHSVKHFSASTTLFEILSSKR